MDTINALGGMLGIPQWFVWRLTWDAEENKFQKVPCYPDGSRFRMDASDRDNWQTFADARAILTRLRAAGDGYAYTLGFWLTADTGYWFFDLDKCLSAGQLSPLAQQLCSNFNGAAWEWSSSGTGLHLFGRGDIPEHRRKDIHRANLEFYTDQRGIAFGLSGQFFGNIETDHTAAVAWLVANYFPADPLPGEILDSAFDGPCDGWNGPVDDAALIERMRRAERHDAAAVFAGLPSSHATFSDLFDNNTATLARCYAGASDADYALIGILSFWTGRDAVRTERIMRESKLYRDKWDSRRGQDTYLRYSILRQFRIAHTEGRDVFGQPRNVRTDVATPDSASAPNDVHGGGLAEGVAAANTAPSLITVTTADPSRKACIDQHRSAFQSATDSTELETAAAIARADPRLTADLAESLAHDLHRRFEEIQVKKKITWCRAILMPERDAIAPGQHREMTEFGNVARMMDRFGNSLMFVDELEKWYVWDESKWTECKPKAVEFMAQQTILGIYEEARTEDNEDVRATLMGWARDSQKNNMVRNMVSMAQSNPAVYVRANVLNPDVMLLGARNGTIDLRNGQLYAPDRHQRITQHASVDYDPGAPCPWFKQTVREAFFDDMAMVVFFKRLMGYSILANPKESKLIIPYGHGANGKSTIMGAIKAVLGESIAMTAQSESFTSNESSRSGNAGGPREDLLRIQHARMLLITEIEEASHLREAMVKTLTGDDTITARGVHGKHSVEFKPRFVPIMPTNHKPIIKGDDNGIWRRIMLVPFERNFKEDKSLPEDLYRSDKIRGELPGVLRWLIEGAIEYQQFGLEVPDRVLQASDNYRGEMDMLREWTDTRLEFGEGFAASMSDLWQSWQQYATPNGYMRFVGTPNALGRKLATRKGFTKAQHVAGLRGRCYVGVRIKSAGEITFGAQS